MSHNLDMNAGRESDGCVVPAKCPNKGGRSTPAEGMEGRRPTKENTRQTAASQMQSWGKALAGLQKFGLELHPDKTRLIEFGRFAAHDRKRRGEGKPETFNFLGFTHICGRTWKSGKFFVLRKTQRERLLAKLKQVKAALRVRLHQPLAE